MCTCYLIFHTFSESETITGFIRGILRGVRYAKSLRVLFSHRRSPSWTTLVLYSRVVFFFNEPTIFSSAAACGVQGGGANFVDFKFERDSDERKT
jgi:hypothetical protein